MRVGNRLSAHTYPLDATSLVSNRLGQDYTTDPRATRFRSHARSQRDRQGDRPAENPKVRADPPDRYPYAARRPPAPGGSSASCATSSIPLCVFSIDRDRPGTSTWVARRSMQISRCATSVLPLNAAPGGGHALPFPEDVQRPRQGGHPWCPLHPRLQHERCLDGGDEMRERIPPSGQERKVYVDIPAADDTRDMNAAVVPRSVRPFVFKAHVFRNMAKRQFMAGSPVRRRSLRMELLQPGQREEVDHDPRSALPTHLDLLFVHG